MPTFLENAPLRFTNGLAPRLPQSILLLSDEEIATWALRNKLTEGQLQEFKKPLARARIVHNESIVEIVGVGSTADRAQLFANMRRAIGFAVQDARSQKLPALEVELAVASGTPELNAKLHEILSESLGLMSYTYKFRKSRAAPLTNQAVMDGIHRFESVQIRICCENAQEALRLQTAAEAGAANADSYNFARYLGDTPANELTPLQLAQAGCDRLKGLAQCHILEYAELEKKGFGGLVAVGKGSKNKPCLAVFDYTPHLNAAQANAAQADTVQASAAKSSPAKANTLVLVGKGLTFDTGGYSIKGKQHHDEMKYDMCGAANVIAAFEVLVRAQPNVRLVGLLACAENMVSEHAQRPGDVFTSLNGKTVEVYNTDAEGRLVLADVLAYAQTFSPCAIADIATLTGGASSIAGNMAGIVCVSDEKLLPEVRRASVQSGEKFVYLEILPEAANDLKSLVADYTNMHNKWGTGAPTMYASAFLKEFVPAGVDWIHLDIANVAWHGRDNGYLSTTGATSFGARTLVAWAQERIFDSKKD